MRGPLFPEPDLAGIEPLDPDSATEIRSAHIIAHMAAAVGATRAEAAKVVDGFWDYVADVRGNYRYSLEDYHVNPRTGERLAGAAVRLPKAYFVIPNFGTFMLRRSRGGKYPGVRLEFRSRRPDPGRPRKTGSEGGLFSRLKRFFSAIPEPKVEEPLPEPTRGTGLLGPWVEYARRPEGLSVKRRMALTISRESGLDLGLTAKLLDAMLLTVLAVFERGAGEGKRPPIIRWARRGTMLPDRRYHPVGSVYRFRCTPGFAHTIADS